MFSPEWFLIGIMVILLIAQQVQITKLINKLMSRNYSDYAQGVRLNKPNNASRTTRSSAVLDPIAERNASEANKLFIA